jgi:lipid-A-disaccharide synthase
LAGKILFVAGDASGDERAAEVARHLKAREPATVVWAVGGAALKGVADRFLLNLVDQSVMGFWEPLKRVPFFWRALHQVIRPAIDEFRPDIVVPVDFFGFNQHVARIAKQAGRRVFYFVGPQVWASRPGRLETLHRWVDRMLLIFPFEEPLYQTHGVPATVVGHPLLDRIPTPSAAPVQHVEPVIGLLPGSRRGEVRRLLPAMLHAAAEFSARVRGARFVLFAAPNLSNAFYDELLGVDDKRPAFLQIVRDEGYEWRSGLDLALTCSGTATLENALLGLPMVVAYRTSWPTYLLARMIVRVRHIAMPNLLADRRLVPELVQGEATSTRMAEELHRLWTDRPSRRAQRDGLLALRASLGGPGAALRAAEEILAN